MSIARAAAVVCILTAAACASGAPQHAVSRERAMAIARAQVRWEPFETQARRTTDKGRQIWRVTMKGRLPGQPPLLFETAIVEVDARTGEIVSVAKT